MAFWAQAFSILEIFVRDYGAGALFVLLIGESLGLPLPGESLLISAAVLAGRGDISFGTLVFSAWAGTVTGSVLGYLLGRNLGRALLLRYGRKIGITAERLLRVENAFARYGAMTVIFARFFIVLRQLNGIVAGTLKMDWPRFLLFNAFGAALWILAWTLFSFYVGLHTPDIASFLHKLGVINLIVAVVAAIVIAVCAFKILIWVKGREGAE